MIFHYIENTNNQYSIRDDGFVYSHYRYKNNGEKIYRDRKISTYIDCGGVRSCVWLNGKRKVFVIRLLMEKYFKLTPPDIYHEYKLISKDGNLLNLALSNLEYRINLLKDYQYYPQPYYDDNRIISKVCGQCGDKIDISHFQSKINKKRGKKKTYKNTCNFCRSKNNWNRIKTNELSYEKYIIANKKWANSEFGKEYYKKYKKEWGETQREQLTDHYLCSVLRINREDLTDKLKELQKKKIVLRRQIFNN